MIRLSSLSRLLFSCAVAVPALPALAQTTTQPTRPYNVSDEVDADDRASEPYRADYSTTEGDWSPDAGDWEITLSGSGNNDKDFENGTFAISADLSTYISEALSLGFRQDVSYSDVTNGGTAWSGGSAVFAQLHFGDGPLRPFVGAGVGYLYGDGVADTFFGGPEGGIRYYVKRDAFIYARATYQFLFDSGDDVTDQFDDGRFVYGLGIGLTF